MYHNLIDKPLQKLYIKLFKTAVKIEKEFITVGLYHALIGMNKNLMSQYIEFVADRLLKMLKLDPVYNTSNPFDWMEIDIYSR